MTQKKTPETEKNVTPLNQGSDVDPIIGEAVGSQLKSLFDGLASESVPDRFTDLIDQLEKNEAAGHSSRSDEESGA